MSMTSLRAVVDIDAIDIDRFVKDPSTLVELCREVIDQLDTSSDDATVAEQEAQLRAIAKAVEQLEKSGVTVPDPLRAEKTRLAASLAVHTDAKQALAQLADEFQEILRDLRDRLGQDAASPEAKPRAKRSKLAKTPQRVLREHIVLALKSLGDKARVSDVIAEMGRQLEGKLLPGDTVWREATNENAWQNNAKWERFQMTQDGILRRGSPRGVWELEEGHQ
jgi:DNA-binding ferritin-like protein